MSGDYQWIRAFRDPEKVPRWSGGDEIGDDRLEAETLFDPIDSEWPRSCIVSRDLLDGISDYTRSHPTAPSVGRVFKKALNWAALHPEQYPKYAGQDPEWMIYVCVSREGDPGGSWHVPFKVIAVIEDGALCPV